MRATVLAGICGVLISGSLVTVAAPAAADSTVEYAVAHHSCAETPAAGDATCFAIGLTPVPPGTPGAQPFTPSAGYATGPAGGYTPTDLQTAYGLTGLGPNAGSGQTVAVIDAYNDPKALADLNTFDSNYGLPAESGSSFAIINQNGAASPLPANDTSGWSGEESLDVDAVRAICNKCKILLVEANSSSFNDLAAGVAAAAGAGATEISNSYGGAEGTAALSTSEKNQFLGWYNYPGVVVTASTGDNGWYGWDHYDKNKSSDSSPAMPASLPDVVSVGGTSLTLNSNATRNTEAVWDEDGPEDAQYSAHKISGASGGGCSLNFSANSWQSAITGFANTGCGSMRSSADVAALADPYTGFDIYDSYNDGVGDGGGWGTYGGTSLASPLIAAMWALAGGSGGVTNPSLSLYGHAKSSGSSFYDVTKGYEATVGVLAAGGNDWCEGDVATTCSNNTVAKGGTNPNGLGKGLLSCVFNAAGVVQANDTQCTAVSGFDGPSGVGTPTGITDFQAMTPSPTYTPPTGVMPGVSTNFSGSATDPFPGGSISSYSWNWGDGTSPTSGASVSHTYATGGTYTVTLSATDNYGQLGSVQHSVTVGTASGPTVTSVSPSSGSTAGGTAVTITGTNFNGATSVKFGTTAASAFTVNSATQISATSPAHAAAAADVTVTTPSGTSTAGPGDVFTYIAPTKPAVTMVSPSSGSTAGGDMVTITGTGFTGASQVTFGTGTPASFTVNSPTQITATSPAHAAASVDVRVTTSVGQSAKVAADKFTYVAAVPVITSVSPSSGPTGGGTVVIITGSGFNGTGQVLFGTTASGFTVNSATQITATSPAHAAGVVDVRVSASGQSAKSVADKFTYVSAGPTVTSVSPSSGSHAGGTVVTITGTGFTGVTQVLFGAKSAGFTVNSPTQISATAPKHAVATVDVQVVASSGESAKVAADKYSYV